MFDANGTNKKKIVIVTNDFPFGNGDTIFLQPEYPFLEQKFDVTIVNNSNIDGTNTEYNIITIKTATSIYRKIISFFEFCIHKEAWDELFDVLKSRHDICKQVYRAAMFGTAALDFWHQLQKKGNIDYKDEFILYFYWNDYRCFGAALQKKRFPNMKLVARTHGYDLYDEREIFGRQFFMPQKDRMIDKLFFISAYGKQYYLKRLNKCEDEKYVLSCLGVHRPNHTNPFASNEGIFHLVSCSNTVAIKRIELIIEGLALIENARIQWTHIGNGSEQKAITDLANAELNSKDNITFQLVGEMNHTDVLDFYAKVAIDCFITTTSTEGNPVSVQEALSFGIPIIATAVSDIPLMIKGNGILLSENPKPKDVAEAILHLIDRTPEEKQTMRNNSYNIWKQDYNADENFRRFVAILEKL